MTEPYKRFYKDGMQTNRASPVVPHPQAQPQAAPPSPAQQPMVCVASAPNQSPLKIYRQKLMKILAVFQLLLAITILLLTVIVLVLHSPLDGSGLWNGVLAIIAGSFGVAAGTVKSRVYPRGGGLYDFL